MALNDEYVINNVKAKLHQYNLDVNFEALNSREQRQLLNIENYIQQCIKIKNECVETYKKNNISKKRISEKVDNISRQTIYNNGCIRKYIENSIADSNSIFFQTDRDLSRYNELKDTYDETKELLDKMIVNIIELNELKLENKKLQQENESIYKRMEVVNTERNEAIRRLNDLENKYSSGKIRSFVKGKE